jgi:hypothetical protein
MDNLNVAINDHLYNANGDPTAAKGHTKAYLDQRTKATHYDVTKLIPSTAAP